MEDLKLITERFDRYKKELLIEQAIIDIHEGGQLQLFLEGTLSQKELSNFLNENYDKETALIVESAMERINSLVDKIPGPAKKTVALLLASVILSASVTGKSFAKGPADAVASSGPEKAAVQQVIPTTGPIDRLFKDVGDVIKHFKSGDALKNLKHDAKDAQGTIEDIFPVLGDLDGDGDVAGTPVPKDNDSLKAEYRSWVKTQPDGRVLATSDNLSSMANTGTIKFAGEKIDAAEAAKKWGEKTGIKNATIKDFVDAQGGQGRADLGFLAWNAL